MSDLPSFFVEMGGEPTVRRLIDRFYDLMDTLPRPLLCVRSIRRTWPPRATSCTGFLVGWLGGPQLYVERFGHPRLRARHLPFAIRERERDQWLLCMRRALDETVPDARLRAGILTPLVRLADHMRNQPE